MKCDKNANTLSNWNLIAELKFFITNGELF